MSEPLPSASRRRARLRARRRRRALVLLALTIGVVYAVSSFVSHLVAGDDPAAVAEQAPAAASAPAAADSAASGVEAGTCAAPAVVDALSAGSDDDVITAFGGGAAFRDAVASDGAPCIDLHDASRLWVVVNKRNALEPLEYWPTPQGRPESTRIVAGGYLLQRTASALDELSAAVTDAGAGTVAVSSGFRPYAFQVETYQRHVANRGQAAADLRSARPGHSEHQTGLAVDVVACDGGGCGDHDGFGGTPQSDWIVDNAWRFGFIVRYESGRTPTTGYSPEPWHLRYLGEELAAAYHQGGYETLEEFFGLDDAPDYT
ncbi:MULTISPECIES: M15 family metallopeptidase [unclassified Microbacterium]|uniref:M15 family metallopeptidase n=1 Tax=unclassified Microbacterium TaxID=2609290 RepID=UPI00386DB1CD